LVSARAVDLGIGRDVTAVSVRLLGIPGTRCGTGGADPCRAGSHDTSSRGGTGTVALRGARMGGIIGHGRLGGIVGSGRGAGILGDDLLLTGGASRTSAVLAILRTLLDTLLRGGVRAVGAVGARLLAANVLGADGTVLGLSALRARRAGRAVDAGPAVGAACIVDAACVIGTGSAIGAVGAGGGMLATDIAIDVL